VVPNAPASGLINPTGFVSYPPTGGQSLELCVGDAGWKPTEIPTPKLTLVYGS
jgi:hypothetical protein